MSEDVNPRIGIVSDSSLQRHSVRTAILSQGYEVIVNCDPSALSDEQIEARNLDAWVIDLEDEDAWDDFVENLVDRVHAPILFGACDAPSIGTKDYARWERRFFKKLKKIVGEPVTQKIEKSTLEALSNSDSVSVGKINLPKELVGLPDATEASRVWVLGASLGGPTAVKMFLDCLPDKLPVAFILAQHIDGNFVSVLAQVLGRHSGFSLKVAKEGEIIQHGNIYITPVDQVLCCSDGQIVAKEGSWEGPYAPSIDQVIQNVGEQYAQNGGAILFSGMGNDGAVASPQMVKKGGTIWIQKPDTCANSSMPESVLATGCVSYLGSPQELAFQLVETIRKQVKVNGF